jgi:hypothetical protein
VPEHDGVGIAARTGGEHDRDDQRTDHSRSSVVPSNTWIARGSSQTWTLSPVRGAAATSVRIVSGPADDAMWSGPRLSSPQLAAQQWSIADFSLVVRGLLEGQTPQAVLKFFEERVGPVALVTMVPADRDK